jgi:hypothetical protein
MPALLVDYFASRNAVQSSAGETHEPETYTDGRVDR